ncbi:MAG: helix-turn-helix domain-containing protein [Candidatus Nanopelagicales bacterium]
MPENPEEPTLADKIDLLFRTVRRPDGSEYSYEAIAEELRKADGPTVSAAYLWQLRKGNRDNPTKAHLEALASFFGVPASYFFDDQSSEKITEQLETLAKLNELGVQQLAFRSADLSPEAQQQILKAIEDARNQEGLNS